MSSIDDIIDKTPMGMYLQDAHPIRDGIRYAQLAEKMGFDSIWQAESRLV